MAKEKQKLVNDDSGEYAKVANARKEQNVSNLASTKAAIQSAFTGNGASAPAARGGGTALEAMRQATATKEQNDTSSDNSAAYSKTASEAKSAEGSEAKKRIASAWGAPTQADQDAAANYQRNASNNNQANAVNNNQVAAPANIQAVDPTTQPKATTQADVNGQSAQERLWQSLDYTYGKQREQSDKAYNKAITQQDNTLLSRGMQRSSYGMQTLANLQNEKVNASNDIYSAQIADYQNRLAQQEEAEAARQFQTSEREATQNWQSGENAANRAFTTSEREATQLYNTGEREATQRYNTAERIAQQIYNTGEREATQAYNTGEREATQAFTTGEREATQNWQSGEKAKDREFTTSEREASQAYNTGEREATQDWQSGEKAKDREFTTSEREASQAYNTGEREASENWQSGEKEKDREASATAQRLEQEWKSGENEKDRAQNQSQFDVTQAFNEKKWNDQQDQWQKEFDYNKMSDQQKIAFNVITAAAANGGDVSDEILNSVGISREDFNAMKTQAATTSSGNPPKADTRPDWEKAGFTTEADYKEALSHGLSTPEQLREYNERIMRQRKDGGNLYFTPEKESVKPTRTN